MALAQSSAVKECGHCGWHFHSALHLWGSLRRCWQEVQVSGGDTPITIHFEDPDSRLFISSGAWWCFNCLISFVVPNSYVSVPPVVSMTSEHGTICSVADAHCMSFGELHFQYFQTQCSTHFIFSSALNPLGLRKSKYLRPTGRSPIQVMHSEN